MNKWMKTYWRSRNQAIFYGGTPEELKYAIKIDDKASKEKIVEDNPGVIEYINNPPEEIQLIAVNSAPHVIKYIYGDGPTEEVQLVAVTNDPSVIYDIYDPSPEVQMAAVLGDPLVIKYIENPTENVKIAAVRNHPLVIKEIDDASLDIQIAAMESSVYACEVFNHLTNIYYSNNYDEDIEIYTDEIPYELQRIALENCGYKALKWMVTYHQPSISEELKKVYIDKHSQVDEWIDVFLNLNIEISEDLMLWALENRKISSRLHKLKDIVTPKVREYVKKYYNLSI